MRPPGVPGSWDEMTAIQHAQTLAFYQTQEHVEDERRAQMVKVIAGSRR